MDEQDDFLTSQYEQLLGIATWARYLAWVVLIAFLCWAIVIYLQWRAVFMAAGVILDPLHLVDFFKQSPSIARRLIADMVGTFLKGIIYFLVLKAISLGLNMIVETDINYREQKRGAE